MDSSASKCLILLAFVHSLLVLGCGSGTSAISLNQLDIEIPSFDLNCSGINEAGLCGNAQDEALVVMLIQPLNQSFMLVASTSLAPGLCSDVEGCVRNSLPLTFFEVGGGGSVQRLREGRYLVGLYFLPGGAPTPEPSTAFIDYVLDEGEIVCSPNPSGNPSPDGEGAIRLTNEVSRVTVSACFFN